MKVYRVKQGKMKLTGIVVVPLDLVRGWEDGAKFMQASMRSVHPKSTKLHSVICERTALTMQLTALYLFHLTCLEGDRLDIFLARHLADGSGAVQTACSIVFRCSYVRTLLVSWAYAMMQYVLTLHKVGSALCWNKRETDSYMHRPWSGQWYKSLLMRPFFVVYEVS